MNSYRKHRGWLLGGLVWPALRLATSSVFWGLPLPPHHMRTALGAGAVRNLHLYSGPLVTGQRVGVEQTGLLGSHHQELRIRRGIGPHPQELRTGREMRSRRPLGSGTCALSVGELLVPLTHGRGTEVRSAGRTEREGRAGGPDASQPPPLVPSSGKASRLGFSALLWDAYRTIFLPRRLNA